jgi:flagellar basal body L-ring protein FlgH
VLQGSEPPTASDKEDRENSVPVAPKRFTRADFVDQAQESGSLWSSGGESNFFFSKNRARSPGDIISIKIEGEMLRDIASEVKRTLTRNERERELDLLEARTQRQPAASASATPAPAGNAPAQDQVATSAAAPETSETGFSAVDVTGSLGLKAGDTLLAEIAERFPNGNYKVRGMKRVPYRNSTKLISFTGVVRGNDLAGEEPVPSGKIYEYRLQTVQ